MWNQGGGALSGGLNFLKAKRLCIDGNISFDLQNYLKLIYSKFLIIPSDLSFEVNGRNDVSS